MDRSVKFRTSIAGSSRVRPPFPEKKSRFLSKPRVHATGDVLQPEPITGYPKCNVSRHMGAYIGGGHFKN